MCLLVWTKEREIPTLKELEDVATWMTLARRAFGWGNIERALYKLVSSSVDLLTPKRIDNKIVNTDLNQIGRAHV